MTRLRLPPDRALLAPGVFDAMSALIAEQAGAEAVYISGAALAYTQLGQPDLGFLDLTRVADATSRIADRVNLPLIVDADTGFGNALNVQRTVKTLEKAGAAAIQIEDQAMPKRCGHLAGKSLIPIGEMRGKVAAALDARAHSDTFIIARTDAVGVEGVEAAFDRAAALIDIGADIVFIEALRTHEEMTQAAARFAHRIPLVANMVEGGRTPIKGVVELGEIGFRLVIAPGALARAYAFMAGEFFKSLLKSGETSDYASRMLDFTQINHLLGLAKLTEIGNSFDLQKYQAAE